MLHLLQKRLCGHLIDRRSAELGVRTQLRDELSPGLDLTERLHFLVFLGFKSMCRRMKVLGTGSLPGPLGQ